MAMRLIIADEDSAGERLDVFASSELAEVSRSRADALISAGNALVNGAVRKSSYKVKEGDRVELDVPEPELLSAEPEDIPLDIVYEDDNLAVINKNKGMVVHPAPGSERGTLVNALMFRLNSLSSINGVIRPGIVHRLDKDTSGLIVIAKNDHAHISLAGQIHDKTAIRQYIGLIDGNLKNETGKIVAPVGRSRKDRKKMAVELDGRYAETDYKVLGRYQGKTLAEFTLHTGRTHQIRVHCKHIGHPVTGDGVYGGDCSLNSDGQLLHAYRLELTHPITGQRLVFKAPLPDGFKAVLNKLGCKETDF